MCTLYSVIVQVFREGDEQAQAIGLFGLSGALGNVMGLVIAVSVFFVWTAKNGYIHLAKPCCFFDPGGLDAREL